MNATKGNAPMPSCNRRDQEKILNVIRDFRGTNRAHAEELVETLGKKELCRVLHSIRRWYTSNNGHNGHIVLGARRELSSAMDLNPNLRRVACYRGFKVDLKNDLADLDEGDEIMLPVTRNGACSSWTTQKALADKFSGASKGKVGLVIKLLSTQGAKAFIAPPERSEPWFNRLYTLTMSGSHRNTEYEYAFFAPRVHVEVVRVKRR